MTAIQYSGPFFERDPAETFGRNARRLMDRVAQVGQDEVRRRVASAPRRLAGPSYSGQYIVGRTRSLGGKRWQATAVISAAAGISAAGLDASHARRVQATLAGRHDGITKRGSRPGRYIGTTRGHEGNARVFARTLTGLRRVAKLHAKMLTDGVS